MKLNVIALGFGLAAAGLAACASTQLAGTNKAEKENEMLPGENKPNAAEIIPKEAKRQVSADARADFEKATKQYADAKKSGGSLSGSECRSVASSFKSAADENPNLYEARFNQGAVLAECGSEDDAIKIWEGMPKYGPAVANLGYIAWKNGDTSRAESLFTKAIEVDPLHTVEARNNLAQILRDKAHRSDGAEKKQYIQSAVSNLRTVLAIDSNNLQAFSTLAFIYYDMNMLEMAKLVGNQAIKKADEIATGKFEEEKVAGADDSGEGKGKGKKGKKGKGDKDEDEPGVKSVDVREAGTGVTPEMKKQLAVVRNTLGLVELKKANISPAIKQFKEAVALDPNFAEARLNLAALSLNNRDYATAEENFREALKMQPKNYEASIGLGVALRGNKKIDDAENQYLAAQKLDSSNPSSYYNLGLLYQDYKDGQKPALHKAQDYYRQFLSHASGSTPGSLKRDAEKRIKDIDEIYVALDEAAKMQAEAEEMQRKAEEQQKQMEEQMKKQEAEEKAAAEKAKGDKEGKPGEGKQISAPGTEPPAATTPPAPGTEAAPADNAGGKKKKGKK
jgi:tetratricopeptide (TPR) repeat protein